jgi:hypothetical protein
VILVAGTPIQRTDAAFVWGVEGFSFSYLVAESVYCHACRKVSEFAVSFYPFAVRHCIFANKVAPDFDSLPFPLTQQLLREAGAGQQ